MEISSRASNDVTIVASVGENNEIGRGGDLCWHIADDLRHFKELTMGGAVIMGRNTWDSLPKKPLPGRKNIVITRSDTLEGSGWVKAESLEEALRLAEDLPIFIIGGESIYRAALPAATSMQLTRISASDPEADKYFPAITDDWKTVNVSETMTTPTGLQFRYEELRR